MKISFSKFFVKQKELTLETKMKVQLDKYDFDKDKEFKDDVAQALKWKIRNAVVDNIMSSLNLDIDAMLAEKVIDELLKSDMVKEELESSMRQRLRDKLRSSTLEGFNKW